MGDLILGQEPKEVTNIINILQDHEYIRFLKGQIKLIEEIAKSLKSVPQAA